MAPGWRPVPGRGTLTVGSGAGGLTRRGTMQPREIMTTKVFAIGADRKAVVASEIMEWAHIWPRPGG